MVRELSWASAAPVMQLAAVAFDLSDGCYTSSGWIIWDTSSGVMIYAVPTPCQEANDSAQDVVIRVEGVNQGAPEPMQGVKVYLFTESASYQGQSLLTDGSGEVDLQPP